MKRLVLNLLGRFRYVLYMHEMKDYYYYRDAKAKHVIAKHVNWIDAKAKHKVKHVNWILANIVDDQPRVNYETYSTISRNINST